jgi:putative membrane protein
MQIQRRNTMKRQAAVIGGAALLVAGAVLGAKTPGQTPAPRPETAAPAQAGAKAGDEAFVTEALMAGMAEVEHGTLASQKATHATVKAFGQQMVADHTKAGDELKTIASAKQIPPPTAMGPKHHATHDKLMKMSGAEFDRAYMSDMVADHQKAVADFTAEATNGTDPQVKAFAAKTLPTIQGHLKMAQDLQKEVAASAK